MCLLAGMCVSAPARAQEPEDVDLSAKQRILPTIGPGLRAVRQGADGRLYVLASPSPGLVVVDTKGKQLLSINEMPTAADSAAASHSLITFGEDCDVDAEGKIYVADRGANLIRIFSGDGTPVRSFPVKDPVSVAAVPEGEIAVATLKEPHLVIVFDKQTHVGLVKVLARKACDELERVLDRVRAGGAQAKEQVVNIQFRDSVANTIDLLFQD